MRDYEAMIILQPNLSSEKLQEDTQKVKDVVTKFGGSILSETKWGKRNLAYPIKKKREGYYLLLSFRTEPASIQSMVQAYRLLDEDVLRTLIIQKDGLQLAKVA